MTSGFLVAQHKLVGSKRIQELLDLTLSIPVLALSFSPAPHLSFLSVLSTALPPFSIRQHHSTGPSLSTTRPIQQYNEDLDNFRNNSKLASAHEHRYDLPPDHPDHSDHVNNLLNCRDSDTHTLLHSMDSLILTSMAKPEYTTIDMPPVYPYPSTNAILQGKSA